MVPDSPLKWVKEARTIAVGEAVPGIPVVMGACVCEAFMAL